MLLVTLYRLGGMLFSAQGNMSFDGLKTMFSTTTHKEIFTMLLDSTLNAIGAWLLMSPLFLLLLYAGLKPVLVRLDSRSSRLKFKRQ